MKMTELQLELIKENLKQLTSKDCFYKEKFQDIDVSKIQSQEDFEKLPFTWKGDLREAYPLGLQAVPDEEVVRIHSSSGTTGTPIIIPYTKRMWRTGRRCLPAVTRWPESRRWTEFRLLPDTDCGPPVSDFRQAPSI